MSVFDRNEKRSHLDRRMFLDGNVTIQRFDVVARPFIRELTKRALSFFWIPEEISLEKDKHDFEKATRIERDIFTRNLSRAILLDSVQARAPSEAFMPFVSIPELESYITVWTSFESALHAAAYSYQIKQIYANPEPVFDMITDLKEIVDCADDISRDYDDLIEYGKYYELLGEGSHTVNRKKIEISEYELKRRLWRTLHAVNCLEGIRFYIAFCVQFAFGEHKRFIGSSQILKLICRDENLHLAGTQWMIKTLPEEDPDFKKIEIEERDYVTRIFTDTVEQEKAWADYLFKDGSIVGLNANMLKSYVEWIAAKRMRKVKLDCPYSPGNANPLPWTEKWIAGKDVQVAPQETEITSYVVGGVDNDVGRDTFAGMSL